MSTENTEKSSNRPTHTVRMKDHTDDNNYISIGVGWQNDNGTITVKLSGKQLIDDAIFLNPIKDKA